MSGNNWLEFAKQDLRLAEVAFGERIYNQTCLHCQQAVEKYLKGYLLAQNKEIPRTHFLDELLNLCSQIDNDFKKIEEGCAKLDDYYIPTRYPDALPGTLPEGLPNQKDAQEAISLTKEIMQFINQRVSL